MKLLQKLRGEMETPRLLLRKWRLSDFNDFVKFAGDKDVMPIAGSRPATTLEEAETQFHRAMRDNDCYAIVLKETGKPIGKIKFQKDIHRVNMNSRSVGYQLNKEYWGNGYMTEALRVMIVRAFEKEKLDVLGISHFTVNQRSKRVVEKCGFVHEGTIHRAFCGYGGEIYDDECYAILREDYMANKEKYLGVEPALPREAGE